MPEPTSRCASGGSPCARSWMTECRGGHGRPGAAPGRKRPGLVAERALRSSSSAYHPVVVCAAPRLRVMDGVRWPQVAIWRRSRDGGSGCRSALAASARATPRRRAPSGRPPNMSPYARDEVHRVRGSSLVRMYSTLQGFVAEGDATPRGYPCRGCLVFLRSPDGGRRKTWQSSESGRRARRTRVGGARRRHHPSEYAREHVAGIVGGQGGANSNTLPYCVKWSTQ